MSSTGRKLGVVVFAVAVLGVLIGLYVSSWATVLPQTIQATPSAAGAPEASNDLVLQTDAAVGKTESPSHPDWVGYLVLSHGKWIRSTVYRVPANSLVHVKIYQFDGDSGLRNPFLAKVQGTSGGVETIDGKPMKAIEAEEASHTFVIPALGVFAPLPGVPEEAKNTCEYGPCDPATMAHRTIEFTFHTGKPGRYRWQCFVPCAAGTYFNFGGPMQTVGYMDGFIDVV